MGGYGIFSFRHWDRFGIVYALLVREMFLNNGFNISDYGNRNALHFCYSI